MRTDIIDEILSSFDVIGYQWFCLANGTTALRITVSDPLTETEKSALRRKSCRIIGFGTATYKYAPEIQYDTILIRERKTR